MRGLIFTKRLSERSKLSYNPAKIVGARIYIYFVSDPKQHSKIVFFISCLVIFFTNNIPKSDFVDISIKKHSILIL